MFFSLYWQHHGRIRPLRQFFAATKNWAQVMIKFPKLFLSMMTAATLFGSQAYAQAVPSSAEAPRAGGQIAPMPTQTLPEVGTKIQTGGAVTAPAGAEKVKLVLKSVDVEGQTVYDEVQIRAVYDSMIGTTITLADVFGIADRLTAKYRNDGYILTQVVVPPQTIDGGHVKLRVVEGFVENVTIQGATRANPGWLEGYAQKLRAQKPLNSKALERYVLLINDLAGMNARAVLSPSKTPGATDITLVVDQKPFDAFFQIDNRGTRFLGPLQLNAGVRFNNTLGLYEGLNFQGVWTPDHTELAYGAFTWQQPLNHEGTRLSTTVSYTKTDPGFTLTPFDVEGDAKTVNLDLTHPFIRSRNKNLYGSLKFNFLNSERTDNIPGGGAEDRLRVLRAGGTFQFTDSLLGVNTLSAEASKGLDFLNASDKGDARLTRALGDPQFFKLNAEVSRTQRITNIFEAYLSATGQLSSDTLLASEEFGVGGVNYGSAYDNSEITGEDGFAARFELRANNPVALPVSLLQLYGFVDGGQVNDPDNAVPRDRRRSLVSAGGGARLNLDDRFAGTLEVAVPMTADVQTEGDDNPRLFASITGKF